MIGPKKGPVHLLYLAVDGAAMATRCRPAPKPARGGSFDRRQIAEARKTRATGWESEVTCEACRLG